MFLREVTIVFGSVRSLFSPIAVSALFCMLAAPASAQKSPLRSIETLASAQEDCRGGEPNRTADDSLLEPFEERQRTRMSSPEQPADGTREKDAISDFVDEVFSSDEVERLTEGQSSQDSGGSNKANAARSSIQEMDWESVVSPAPRETPVEEPHYPPATRDPIYGKVEQTTYTWAPRVLAHRTLYFEDMPLERYGQSAGDCLQPIKSGIRFLADAVTIPLQMIHEKPCDLHYVLPLDRPGVCSQKTKQPIVPYVPR